METPELKPRSIDRRSRSQKSFKEAKRNVNERSKRNFAKILKRGSLCIVFRVCLKRTLTTAQQERFRKDQFWVSKKSILQANNWSQDQNRRKSSYKEHRVDALAPYADEGRGKLRKATGSRKQAPIRRYPNGGTRQPKRLSP